VGAIFTQILVGNGMERGAWHRSQGEARDGRRKMEEGRGKQRQAQVAGEARDTIEDGRGKRGDGSKNRRKLQGASCR
jgi:hypothetical protein